jgi:hypothetical protein
MSSAGWVAHDQRGTGGGMHIPVTIVRDQVYYVLLGNQFVA